MLQLDEAVLGRVSVRQFRPDPVPLEDIRRILELASHAANAGNMQMWRFHVVTSSEVKERMRRAIAAALADLEQRAGLAAGALDARLQSSTFFVEAPTVIGVSTERYRSQVDKTLLAAGMPPLEVDELRCRPDLQSIGAMVQTLMLAAYSRGYGTCYMTGPMLARPALEQILGIGEPRSLACLVPIGRPVKTAETRPRKPLDEVAAFLD